MACLEQITTGQLPRLYSALNIRHRLEQSNYGYRLLLFRDFGALRPSNRPDAPWHNAVLKTHAEASAAIAQVKSLGLPVIGDTPKNWDSLAALDCILKNTTRRSRILDAGAEVYSVILQWLFLYGYKHLEGINLVFTDSFRRGPIRYRHGDITRTDYRAESFDAITCLSVIEHGVDLEKYFTEVARILRPGGVLITSTDYWADPIATAGKTAYGVPVQIFAASEISAALEIAAKTGLMPTANLDMSCDEKVVHWGRVELDYTFILFTLRKVA